jgi:hypothetical protein
MEINVSNEINLERTDTNKDDFEKPKLKHNKNNTHPKRWEWGFVLGEGVSLKEIKIKIYILCKKISLKNKNIK